MIYLYAFVVTCLLGYVIWFYLTQPRNPVTLVEVEKRLEMHSEDEESIRALAHHPGFVALMNRYHYRTLALKNKLCVTAHADIREVDRLQAFIEAYTALETDVNKTIFKKREAVAVSTTTYEKEQFNKAFALIEGV